MKSSVLNHVVVGLLAGVAFLATSGCDPSGLLENSGERRTAEWLTGHNFIFRCEGGSLQTYTIQPDGELQRADAPVNGEDCEPSDYDNGRANTISGVTSSGSGSGVTSSASGSGVTSSASGSGVTSSGSGVALQRSLETGSRGGERSATQTTFGSIPPLPFAPWFPVADLAGVSRTCAPGGSAYVVNHRSSAVTKFDLCPLARSTRITVGSNPLQAALTPDGRTLLVTRFDGGVVFVDTRTDSVIATLTASSIGSPNGIAITPDGARAYVSNYDDADAKVTVIDIASRTVVGSVATSVFPKSLFLTPDGQQLWILHYQTTAVTIIDTLSLTVVATVDVGSQAEMGMAFDPSGTRAYIGTGANRIVVLDTATLDQIARIQLPFLPSDIAVTPDGSRIVVNSWSDSSAAVLDARTNQVLKVTPRAGSRSMGLVLYR